MSLPSVVRVPGSYSNVDSTGAVQALPDYRVPIAIIAPRIKPPASWLQNTAYSQGAMVQPTDTAKNGHFYVCLISGTSGATEPAWPTSGTVVSGTATFRQFCNASKLAAVNTPTPVFSAEGASAVAGNGSIAHRMAAAAFRVNKYSEIDLILCEDRADGVKASATITISGTATTAGSAAIYVGNDLIQVNWPSTANSAAIAVIIQNAILDSSNLSVLAVANGSVVMLQAKNAGTPGNLLGKWNATTSLFEPVVSFTGSGVAFAKTGFASGAGDPTTLADAFSAASAGSYAIVLTPYKETAELALLTTYMRDASDEVNGKGVRSWIATTKSIAAATTAADENYERLHVCLVRGAKYTAYEIAAGAAAMHASTGHPALPVNGLELVGCDTPAIEDRLEWLEMNTLLQSGVTPFNADTLNVVRCIRSVTTYTTNSTGSPDTLYLDSHKIACLDYFRNSIRVRHGNVFKQAVLRDNHVDGEPSFVVTPGDVADINYDVAKRNETYGTVQNVDLYKDAFISTRAANGRVNSDIPAEIVEGLHVLVNTIRIVSSL